MAMGKLKKWFSDDEGEDTSRLDDDFLKTHRLMLKIMTVSQKTIVVCF